ASHQPIFHPGRQGKIVVDGVHVGMMGELHPDILQKCDIPQRVLFAECDMQELLNMPRKSAKMQELSLFPSSDRDWTVTVSTRANFAEIIDEVMLHAPAICEEVSLKTIFQNEKLGSERQNVTLHFVYRSRSKTISQEEVETAHQALIAR